MQYSEDFLSLQDGESLPSQQLTPEQQELIRTKKQETRDLLKQKLRNPEEKKMFRNAYCFKAGFDYSSLKPYCENIIQVTDGFSDPIDVTRRKIESGLSGYDSNKDVIVMAGRAIDHFIAGQVVVKNVMQKPIVHQSYAVAMYLNPVYMFYEIFLDPAIDSEEKMIK